MNKAWYIYMILTQRDKIYTGISTDPERRFIEHLCDPVKGAKFFRSDRPVRIVYLEEVDTLSEALKRELFLKKLSSQNKKKLIE